ncbi:hypothetical protein DSECCO2_227190 [anaerobic digester metagenome]
MKITENPAEHRPLTNRDLFEKQMAMLKVFLDHGAISQEQYDVSANGLIEKMHLQPKE